MRASLASLLVTSLALATTVPAYAGGKKRPAKAPKKAKATEPAPAPDAVPAPEGTPPTPSGLGDPADAPTTPPPPPPSPAPQAPVVPTVPAKPPTAAAKAQAKVLQKEATKLYNVQQYDKAAELYQQAYLLAPNPAYLYASAQSQRLGGDCTKALQSYQAYIRANPAETERAKAQANIERCEQELREHEAAVSAEQVTTQVDVPAPPTPPPAAVVVVAPAQGPEKSYLVGHVLLGAGVVAIAGGSFLFYSGRSSLQVHNSAATYDEYVAGLSDVDSAKTSQTLGLVTIGAGVALVGGAIAYYVLHSRSGEQAPPVQAIVTARSASVSYTLTF